MKINKLTGINNIGVPEKRPLGTCTEATNVVVNGDGQIGRRPGSKLLSATPVIASYGTFDQSQLFYVTDAGHVMHFDGSMTEQVGLVAHQAPCFWAEESPAMVFMAQYDSIQVWQGTGSFIPLPTTAPGLETGTKPLVIVGEIVRINWVAGRLCVASYLNGFSRLTFSVAGIYGRVPLSEDWFEIPHLVTGLESFATNLVITTTDAIFLYNVQTGILAKTVEYGTPVGRPIARYGADRAFIWTTRGVVTYPEWKNITKDTYLTNPGEGCGSAIIQYEGNEYLLVSHDEMGINYETDRNDV